MNKMLNNNNEIYPIAEYLNIKVDEALLNKYNQLVNSIYTDKDDSIDISPMLQSRLSISLADAGFAYLNPNHKLRNRILALSVLIETDPNYVVDFISEKKTSFAMLRFILLGVQSVIKTIIGITYLKLRGWK